MKKDESEFAAMSVIFAEDIRLTESEHRLPEIWISERFFEKFKDYLRTESRRVSAEEIILKSDSGNLVDVYRVILADKALKKEIISLVRSFLEAIQVDLFESTGEDSESPDFEFILPHFSIKKR